MATETDLRDWRYGPIQAERLAAGILAVEGYEDIDPQATLGGADDKKDILARKDGRLWIAAIYFPPTPKRFPQITNKFTSDLEGVTRHGARGFVFFVNQPLTLGQRRTLEGRAPVPATIYHLERMRHVLDSPRGYGLRLEYLRRQMTLEEQVAFFNSLGRDLTRQLRALEQAPTEFAASAIERTVSAIENLTASASSINKPAFELSDLVRALGAPMATLTLGTLGLLHRVITEGDPVAASSGGQLRSVEVWIGTAEHHTFVPTAPEEIPDAIARLLEWWHRSYPTLVGATEEDVVLALAQLHHGLLAIHPFVDGNGRLARVVTDLAAQELLGRRVGAELTRDRGAYFESLGAGHAGDLQPLAALIRAALL